MYSSLVFSSFFIINLLSDGVLAMVFMSNGPRQPFLQADKYPKCDCEIAAEERADSLTPVLCTLKSRGGREGRSHHPCDGSLQDAHN